MLIQHISSSTKVLNITFCTSVCVVCRTAQTNLLLFECFEIPLCFVKEIQRFRAFEQLHGNER